MKSENKSPQCDSQQTVGKNCREDPWLKAHPDLWCSVCSAAQALEDALNIFHGLGYV